MPQDELGSGNAPVLAVWCADRAAAGPVLQDLETGFTLEMCTSLREAGLAVQDGRDVVLLYQPFSAILQRAAENGIAPHTSLPDWEDQTRSVLALHRQNRRQVRLIDTSAARANPGALRAVFNLPEIAEKADDDDVTTRDALLGVLARHYLLDDPEGRVLSLALDAASVVLTPSTPGHSVSDAAFQDYCRQREDTGILRQQSHAMQAELTALHSDRDTLNATLESEKENAHRSEQRIAQLQSRGDTLEEELAQVREEAETAQQSALQIELLQAQTRAMQEELEAMAERNHEMEAEVQALKQGMENYQNRMADLREHQDGLGRRLAAKEQNLKAAGQMIVDLETYGQDQRQALARKAKSHEQTRAALDVAQSERDQIRADLERLVSSRSFRLTAPLRRVAALFARGGRS